MNPLPWRRLGPTCPFCGYPWGPGRAICARCGFDPSAPAENQWGLLTVFGYGLCGAIAGAQIGLAGALASTAGPRLPHVAVLAGLGMGVLGWGFAAGIGRRLAPDVRCAYEHLLLAAIGAGLVLVISVLSGVVQPELMFLTWTLTAAGIFALLRRYGYQTGPHSRGT